MEKNPKPFQAEFLLLAWIQKLGLMWERWEDFSAFRYSSGRCWSVSSGRWVH